MRLIDADALMPKLKFIQEAEHQIYGKESWGFASKCIAAIEDASPIEERKTGKAIVKSTGYRGYWACDQCGTEIKSTDNFCRNCGADLRGEQE